MTQRNRRGRRGNWQSRSSTDPQAATASSVRIGETVCSSLQSVDDELEYVAQRWAALVARFDRTHPGLESRLKYRVDCLLRREPERSQTPCSDQCGAASDYWLG